MNHLEKAVNPAQKEAVLQHIYDLLTDGVETPTIMLQVLNDAYFIHIKSSHTYKDAPDKEKEDIDYTFALVNTVLLKLQEVA